MAYKILDTGASEGIIVSPLGLQEGAAKIAARENVLEVQLNANCTPDEFVLKFLNKIMIGTKETGRLGDSVSIEIYRNCRICGQLLKLVNNEMVCPECLNRE